MAGIDHPITYADVHGRTVVQPVVPDCPDATAKAMSALPHRSLTEVARAQLRARGINPDKLSAKKFQKFCQQILASATNRPDLRATTWLSPALAYAFNLHLVIQERLFQFMEDPTALVNFFLANIDKDEKELKKLLRENRCPKAVIKELLAIKDELGDLLGTTHTYFRHNGVDGQAVGDQLLTHTIPSPADRTNPNVHNARVEASAWDNAPIAYAGRLENQAKAKRELEDIIRTEIAAGRTDWETLENDGYDWVVTSLMKTKGSEGNWLQQERETLRALNEITIDGHRITIRAHLFARQVNNMELAERAFDDKTSGKGVSDAIRLESEPGFRAAVTARLDRCDADTQNLVRRCLNQLEQERDSLLPEEEILLRDIVCKAVGIPLVYHCKSQKDRTVIAGFAISTALRKWINLAHYIGNPVRLAIPHNPLDLLKDERFKELILQSLPPNYKLTQFGLGGKGVINGEEFLDDRIGFHVRGDGNNFLTESNILTRILPKRVVEAAPVKAIVFAFGALIASIVMFLVRFIKAIGITLIWLPRIHFDKKDVGEAWKDCGQAFVGIFLFWRAIKTHQINTDAIWNGEHQLFYKKPKGGHHIAPVAKPIVDDIGKLSFTDIRRLKNYLLSDNPNPVTLTPADRQLLIRIANNFELLKDVRNNPKLDIPGNFKTLMDACKKSKVVLFSLPQAYTTGLIEKVAVAQHLEPIQASLQRQIDENGISLEVDIDGYNDGDGVVIPNRTIYNQVQEDYIRTQNSHIYVADGLSLERIRRNGDELIGLNNLFRGLQKLPPFSDPDAPIPLCIQAGVCQTGKSNFMPFQEGLELLSCPEIATEQAALRMRQKENWKIEYHALGPNKIVVKYSATYVLRNFEDMQVDRNSLFGELDFSFALVFEKNAESETWEQTDHLLGSHTFRFVDADRAFTATDMPDQETMQRKLAKANCAHLTKNIFDHNHVIANMKQRDAEAQSIAPYRRELTKLKRQLTIALQELRDITTPADFDQFAHDYHMPADLIPPIPEAEVADDAIPPLHKRIWTSLTGKEYAEESLWGRAGTKLYRWTAGRVNQLFIGIAWAVVFVVQSLKTLAKHFLYVIRIDVWGNKIGISNEWLRTTFPKGVMQTEYKLCLLALKATALAVWYLIMGPRRERLQHGHNGLASPLFTKLAWKGQLGNMVRVFDGTFLPNPDPDDAGNVNKQRNLDGAVKNAPPNWGIALEYSNR